MAETEAETFSRNWRTGTLGLSGPVTRNRNTVAEQDQEQEHISGSRMGGHEMLDLNEWATVRNKLIM